MGSIEPSTGGAILLNVFVVPKHTGCLPPIFSLKLFNYYIHKPTFKMPTIRQVQQLIQQGIMLFLLILRMLICILPLLGIIIIFYISFGNTNHISGRFYELGWPQALGF